MKLAKAIHVIDLCPNVACDDATDESRSVKFVVVSCAKEKVEKGREREGIPSGTSSSKSSC